MYPPILSIDFIALSLTRLVKNGIWVALWQIWDYFYSTDKHPARLWLSIVAALVSGLIYLWPSLEQLQYGVPRKVDWAGEIAVVTGGSRGLGRLMAEMLANKGAAVVVLDVIPFKRGLHSESIAFIRTDVGDEASVLLAKERIVEKLGQPTILINNAGIVSSKTMLELQSSQIETSLRVNLLAHFHTIRAFLPGMQALSKGGTIVTVSSILGVLGAAQLTDYAAAKAGLNAMHVSLRAELDAAGHSKMKTILVKPGQLGTAMFESVQTPSSFLGPVVPPEELARVVVQQIATGQTGHIALPLYAQFGESMTMLPMAVAGMVRKLTGIDRAMNTFVNKDTLS